MLYLCQIVEVKKLTQFFSQFSLGDYSVGHEFQALLFHLGKENTHESRLVIMYTELQSQNRRQEKFCEEMKQYL